MGAVIIAAAVFACYRPTLQSRFLYDDINLIVLNTRIRDVAHLKELVAGGRPVRSLTFMLDYALWGYSPRGYHFTNICLHALASSLVFLYFRRLFKEAVVAFGAGLLFATHPAATEAVAAISHRKEMLALIFMLISLLSYNSASRPAAVHGEGRNWPHPRWVYYSISFCSYFLALASKQVAIVTPLLMWVTDSLCSRESAWKAFRNRWLLYAPLIVLPFMFVLIKMGDWRIFGAFPAEGLFSAVYFKVLRISAWAITRYLILILWPVHLHVDYSIPDPSALCVISGVALFIGLLLASWRFRRSPLWSFGLLWAPLNLAPVLNLVPANEPFSERYLYIPLAGGCLLLSAMLERLSRGAFSEKFFKSLLFLWISALSATWLIIMARRHNEITPIYIPMICAGALILWGSMRLATGRRYIGSPVGRVVIAFFAVYAVMLVVPGLFSRYLDKSMFWSEEGYTIWITHFQKAFPAYAEKLDPQKLIKYRWLRVGSAETIFALALLTGLIGAARGGENRLRSFAVGISLLLMMFGGMAYFRAHSWRTDRNLWTSTLKENPNSSKASVNLAVTSRKGDNYRVALWAYSRAVNLDPRNSLLRFDYGLALLRLYRFDEAEVEFEEAIKSDPRNTDAHLNLGNLYQSKKKYIAAANEYREVLQMDPGNVKAMFNLALVYREMGDVARAMEACRSVLQIMPGFQKARDMCGGSP